MTGTLKENLKNIQKKIQAELENLDSASSPLILAVSKKQPAEKIRELYGLGICDFGENYLQEAQEKKDLLKDLKINWHYIGQIQRKKLKDIVGNFDLIQTVSRVEEVSKIQEIARQKNITQKILIQVNIAKEETKGGVVPDELEVLVNEVMSCENISLQGLMFFPPLSTDESETLNWLEKCSALYKTNNEQFGNKWTILSLGTSSDYHLATRKGSSMVRVGELLMGARPV